LLLSMISCDTLYYQQQASQSQQLADSKRDIENNAKTFHNNPKKALLLSWGKPASISSDGDGGEIYRYSNSTRMSYGVLTSFIDMFIDKEGIVYASKVTQTVY